MNISRRKILGIIGGGTIFAATAGIGGFLATRTPHKAREPWDLAGGYVEPRRRALSYAILSPNPHNRQPWMVDLDEPDKIILYADMDRLLPHTDPYNRQITIGLGCFLELLRMAAAEDGYEVTVEAFPDGFDQQKLDERPIAIIKFNQNGEVKKDPLFAHVLNRQSLKQPFDLNRDVPDDILQKLNGLEQGGVHIDSTNAPESILELRQLTREAMAKEIATQRTHKESVDLFRIGKAEINANPDGISLGGPMIDGLAAIGAFSREASLEVGSTVYQQGINVVMANADTAMGYVWLVTDANSRIDQLNVGRDWMRTHLTLTANGVATQPLSQALQEYPEMAETFAQIHRLLNAEGKVVQMLARLGYAEAVAQSPRWPLEAKILKT